MERDRDKNRPLGLGLIGCGSFGRFALKAFGKLPGDLVRPVAASHVTSRPSAADRDLGVPVVEGPDALLARPDVDIVHIATPPASHHDLVMKAVGAGKHVLCEKPLALTTAQADAMIAAARDAGTVLAVTFVLRYCPVTDAVKRVVETGVLGKVLAGRLTNCGSDAGLGPNHWFWDKSISGGIFVEHGVHFFDMYRYWLGDGQVIAACAETRDGGPPRGPEGLEDRVACIVRHAGGALVSHYHGFDRPPALDRTDHRLVCEMGDIRVCGWVPLRLEVDAAVDDRGARRLADCCPWSNSQTLEKYEGGVGRILGRGVERHVTQRLRLTYTPNPDKQSAYQESLRWLLADQIAYIRDRSHNRVITEANGREALALAEGASQMARGPG